MTEDGDRECEGKGLGKKGEGEIADESLEENEASGWES